MNIDNFDAMVGTSPGFENLIRSAKMVASTDVTVLIQGETGSGKEVFASSIQKAGPRADAPFITLNCAALPESIVESELFGHKKGSFTNAIANKPGIFKAADKGTLFLDEIDSLPLPIQAKLLRFLETGECQMVGETEPYHVDTRIIAATNSNLSQKIKQGEFRQDLFYRLNVVPLVLPSLRERCEDVEKLIKHFVSLCAAEHGIKAPKFNKQALKKMKTYAWPGNVRELRNLCERLCILLPGCEITPENLPYEFNVKPSEHNLDEGFRLPTEGLKLDSLEVDLIQQALVRTNGNRSKSARLLGISRDTLLYRIQKYGLATH